MTSWHAAAFSDSAEPATHQALAPSAPIWLWYKLMFVTDPFIFSASAKACSQRQIKVGVLLEGPLDKPWFLKCSNEKTFNWDMSNLSDSKRGKTIQKSKVWFSLYIASTYSMTYSWIASIWQLNSIRDERWNYSTCKPSKLLTVRGCRKHMKTWHHDMPQHSAILRSPPHTRPWRPRRQSGWIPNWCMWLIRLSSVPRLRPGGSDRSRLASRSWALQTKPDYWNAQKKDIQLRHVESLWFKTWKNNPEIHGFIQHLHTVWHTAGFGVFDNSTRSEMNDETTAPANHPNFSL